MKTYIAYDKKTGALLKRWSSNETDKKGKPLDENYFEPSFPKEYELEIHDLGDIPAWRELIRTRNKYLSETDWAVMPDCNLPEKVKQEFLAYRQILRDIPQNLKNPKNVEWPVRPKHISKTEKMLKKMLTDLEGA